MTKKTPKSPFKNPLISKSDSCYSCGSCLCSIEENFRKTRGKNEPKQLHLALVSLILNPTRPSRFGMHRHFLVSIDPTLASIHQAIDLGARGEIDHVGAMRNRSEAAVWWWAAAPRRLLSSATTISLEVLK